MISLRLFRRSKFTLGIRREDKGRWERRVPLTPVEVAKLSKQTQVLIQPSSRRIFSDEEFRQAGAIIEEDLSRADVILGVKEVPTEQLIPQKSYMFFSHTHKGQKHNLPMLKDILEKKIRLLDYELLVDEKNMRLVAFGRHAGYSGMINALHGLGQRLLSLGHSTPLINIGRTHHYYQLDDAKHAINAAGKRIADYGLPKEYSPFVVMFTGNGNVSQGAQEVFKSLPHEFLSLKDLKQQYKSGSLKQNKIYGVVLDIQDYIRHNNRSPFDLKDYFANGKSAYHSVFHSEVLPYTSLLVNGAYWDEKYPRLLTNDQFEELTRKKSPLIAIADISCDLNGPLEFMDHASTIDDPFFFYDPIFRKQHRK